MYVSVEPVHGGSKEAHFNTPYAPYAVPYSLKYNLDSVTWLCTFFENLVDAWSEHEALLLKIFGLAF